MASDLKTLRQQLTWALFALAVALILGGVVAWLTGHKHLADRLFLLAGTDILAGLGEAVVAGFQQRR